MSTDDQASQEQDIDSFDSMTSSDIVGSYGR